MYGAVDSFTLLALPTFVLAGELLNRCELTDKLIEFCQRLVGWIGGGLAHVTVTASMLLAGITGSTLSDAATIAPIMIPSMIKEKYPREFAGALVASASVIGAIIPPSIPLVIIGAQLGISIGGLLVGGILPGIVVGITLMIASYVAARLGGFGAIRRFEGFRPLARSTWIALPVLGVHPVQYGMFLMVGLLLGVLTPPVGLVLFIVAPIARLTLERLSLAVLPYLALEFVILFVIATVPELTLALPRLAGYVT